ncbi:hypothetical protein CAEBREN_15271 [Caenorhabditis brenneri]|uniref:Serpentine receptor class r-10 n=1 Tax=Caenorhabditis brenneri TaxID=135651 RepID=G0NWB9_CAEBE|nr:hypothetical protein CAEBREN_15271 [Caenorhabditis brenneri]
MLWLHIIQCSGFIFSQITNSIVIFLILKKADKLFGSYRNVMLTFACYSLIYAWIEVLTSPIMHIKGPVFIVFMDSPLKYEKWIGNYIACQIDILKVIEKYKLIPLFIPCLFGFVLWFEFVHWGMANTVEKQEYLKEELKLYYNEDSTKVSFIAPMYWSIGKNGEKIWNIGDCMSAVGCFLIIVTCFSTILFCAFNIYRHMKKSKNQTSTKTNDLHLQIFTTLVFQTFLPFFMMNCPVGLLLTFPLFEIHTGKLSNIVGASAAVYPSLEPLIAMFCIRSFRRALTCD